MKKLSSIIVFSLFLSFSAQAADKNGQFAVKGVGNATCSSYVKELNKGTTNSFLFAGWINGYLTAQNQQLKETFDLISWETIHTLGNYLVSYCDKNPDKSFYMAMTTMLGGLYDQRITLLTPAVTIKGENGSIRIYKEIIQRAQKALTEKKLYKGAIDGIFNKEMLNSISAFQKEMELPVTGVPDQMTLFKLLPKK